MRRSRACVPSYALPRILAALLAAVGAIDLLSALTPSLAPRLQLATEIVGGRAVGLTHTATVIVGLCLLMLARSVGSRQQRGARLAFALLLLSAALNVLKGLDLEEAAFSLFVAGLIYRARDQFVVGALPISWHGAAARTGWLAGLIVVYAETGALLIGRDVQVLLTIGSSARPAPFALAAFAGLWTDAPTVRYLDAEGRWFHHSLHALVIVGVAYAAIRLLRPLIPLPPATQEERARARALVTRYGTDSLSYFHLRPDRSYIFAPHGLGMVSFAVRGDVALLGGDPVAAPGALQEVVSYALEALALQGLTPCVVGASARAMRAYRAAGMRAIKFGEEAVIELPAFAAERLSKRVRRAARHVDALGIRITVGTMARIDPRLSAQCPAVGRAWLGMRGGHEQGFSMTSGPLPGPHDDDHLLVLATEAAAAGEERVLGFITLAPVPAERSLSLDHMRRLPEAPNGLTEALIIHAAEYFRDAGYARLSLNFAALCDKEHPEGERAPVLAARRAIFEYARHLPLRSLYVFNKKFDPSWSCRYWLYAGAASLPAAAYATIRAEVAAPTTLLPGAFGGLLRLREPATIGAGRSVAARSTAGTGSP